MTDRYVHYKALKFARPRPRILEVILSRPGKLNALDADGHRGIYPGLDEDLYITAEAEAFVKWHAGQLSWAEATRNRRIQLHGPSWLVRAFPTWNARSAFAHIKPVSRSAASSVA